MNGPEHYREAERLVEEANLVGHVEPDRADGILRAAQVHATLALTAATLENDGQDGLSVPATKRWAPAFRETEDDA